MIIKEKSLYRKFIDWSKEKLGDDVWEQKYEGEDGRYSLGEYFFIIIPLVTIYMIFQDFFDSIFDKLNNTLTTYFNIIVEYFS